MANDLDMLKKAISSSDSVVQRKPFSYEEIKAYYVKEYGERGWKGAYAKDVTGSESKSGKAYLAARRSVEQFEAGKTKSSVYTTDTKLGKIAENLPLQWYTDNKITLHMEGEQGEVSSHGAHYTSKRNTDVTINAETAMKIMNDQGGWPDVWDDYGVNDDLMEYGDYEYAVASVSAA